MLDVAVGVITNLVGDVLISRRAHHVHQGGLWEFPGGKLERNENTFQALRRELQEELGIYITKAHPLITIIHDYGDKKVCLHVLHVDAYEGAPAGLEQQPVKWVSSSNLSHYTFPDANQPIIKALSLPEFYPIVDSSLGDEEYMIGQLERLIAQGYKQIQLRAKTFSCDAFMALARNAISLCKSKGATLFLNTSIEKALLLQAEAVHLGSLRMHSTKEAINHLDIKVAVSCHTKKDLKKAAEMGACFAVLSPVCPTESHPKEKVLGWDCFNEMVTVAKLPVYALGGLNPTDLSESREQGAQGVAGIRGF